MCSRSPPRRPALPGWVIRWRRLNIAAFLGRGGRYLTPAGTQGFAPHYDDIEAFLLQAEGSKQWRLYDNPSGERLPTTSSGNFAQRELGPAIMEVTLRAGDLLYIPRGVVHQVATPP